METCGVVLTFKSVDEILWCDHSNETSSAVFLHGTIYFSMFYKMKFGTFLEFLVLTLLGVKKAKLKSIQNEGVYLQITKAADGRVRFMSIPTTFPSQASITLDSRPPTL